MGPRRQVTAADNEPKFDILGRLKILNLTALIMRDFDLKLNDYMKQSYDIINNNDDTTKINEKEAEEIISYLKNILETL